MKILFRLILMGVLVFGFVGCGGGGGDAPKVEENTTKGGSSPTPITDETKSGDISPTSVNSQPTSGDLSISTFKNTITNGIFLSSDKDDTFLLHTIESNSSHGVVNIIENSKSFKYTPNKDFVGEDSFTYRAFDGGKYSNEATVTISVKEIETPTVSDTTAPTSTMIVSLDAHKNAITLFWLGATDDVSSSEQIRYEIHLSTDMNFTIDSSTLKQTLVNTLEADISGLEADTLYYIKIKAIDNNENFSISSENSIKTLLEESTIGSNVVIKKATDLHLENAQKLDDKLIFDNSANAQVPFKGDILIGNPDDAYLKRVLEVTKDDNTTEITVEDVAISEVIQSTKLSSKVLLFDTADITENESMKKIINYKSNSVKESTTSWGSGRFSIIDTQKPIISNRRLKVTQSNTDFEVVIVKSNIAIAENQTIIIDVEATMKEAGIEDAMKFYKFELVSFEHDGDSDYNNYGALKTTNKLNKEALSGSFKWTPRKKHVSSEPYIATFKVYAKDTECSDIFDSCSDSVEEIEAKITVIGDGKVDTGGVSNKELSYGTEFSNDVTLDFTPTLTIDHEIDGHSLDYAKVALNGKLTFDVLSIFKYSASANYPTKSVALITPKTYKSVYLAGGIPIYQEITITIDAEFSAVAEGSVEAKSDLQTSFEIEAGMEYKNGVWQKIAKNDLRKDYTATITAEGGVKVNVRLIPNIEIKFYKVASAGLSIEPWLSGDLRASATAKFNTDFVDSDTMAIHRVENLDILVGIDAKVYADLTVWEWNLAHYPSEENDANGDGKKTIFDTNRTVFSIPKIKLESNGVDICSDDIFKVNATITNPTALITNNFVDSSIEWFVFPSAGATITPSNSNIKEVTFNFNKKDNYTVYMVGHNEKLGSIVGQQYETFEVDTRDCIIDNTPPVITLNGEATLNLTVGDTYEELGATTDDRSEVIITGTVDTSIADTYTIRYNATDTAGNHAIEETRTINVIEATEDDTTSPIITLNGEATLNLTVGDTYEELGATTDDGSEVIITGTVDTSIADTYIIRYNATDTANNHAIEKTRTITVTDQALSPVTLDIGDTTTKEEQKTIVIPINERDVDNRIDSVTCTSNPNTIDFINTNAIITINMPKYSDIQQFTMECIAYDSLSEELDRDSVVVTVSEIIPTPTSTQTKKTGQSTTYTSYDDGYYQKGISHSYTRDDTKQIVTDHVTGLQWQDNETISKPWVTTANYSDTSGDTATTYCSDLTLGGYSDWRLPSSTELESIVDYGKYNPSISTVFENTSSSNYWSSSTYEYSSSYAWIVDFDRGGVYNSNKSSNRYVRCVRAGE